MFSKDFYPTPEKVIEIMCNGLSLENSIAYDPQAGSGNILQYLKSRKAIVYASENNEKLSEIAKSYCDKFIGYDFFDINKVDVCDVKFIIMNPPFSNQEDHILHAWEIAPPECIIVTLCNHESISNPRNKKGTEIIRLSEEFGSYEKLGKIFIRAERSTAVDIGIIRLIKPKDENQEDDFSDFFSMDGDEEDLNTGEGIIKHNDVYSLVKRYVGAIKMFDDVENMAKNLELLIEPINHYNLLQTGIYETDGNRRMDKINKKDFSVKLQQMAWRHVFKLFNIEKYATVTLKEKLDIFIKNQENLPFSMRNIFNVVEIIYGTRESRLNMIISDAFDSICSFSYENSEAKDGWKTNSNYKVNKKFIIPYCTDYDSRWPREFVSLSYSAGAKIDDINKALCFITGINYDLILEMSYHFSDNYKIHVKDAETEKFVSKPYDSIFYRDRHYAAKSYSDELNKNGHNTTLFYMPNFEWGEWYEWAFYRIKFHKKGTAHFEFLDEKVWQAFNHAAAKAKGWALPKETDNKKKGTERKKSKKVEIFEK